MNRLLSVNQLSLHMVYNDSLAHVIIFFQSLHLGFGEEGEKVRMQRSHRAKVNPP